jgi:hypothetical protein
VTSLADAITAVVERHCPLILEFFSLKQPVRIRVIQLKELIRTLLLQGDAEEHALASGNWKTYTIQCLNLFAHFNGKGVDQLTQEGKTRLQELDKITDPTSGTDAGDGGAAE